MIFNIALEQAKEKNVSFESQIGIVINAFLISKKEIEIEEQKNNTSPFEMNMAPPKKNDTDTDIYGGPYQIPMDTQRVDNDYRIGI